MAKKTNGKKGLEQALEKVGGTVKLAKGLKITPQAISQWKKRVPVRHVLDVERLTGVHRHYLNPEFYPEPPDTRAA